MTSESSQPNDPANVETTSRTPVSSLGALAKTIRGRTTDLLAIGVVLIAGLTFGRQVITWWHADEPRPGVFHSPMPANWGSNGDPIDVRFADLAMGFARQTCLGTEEEVRRQFIALCMEKTRSARVPDLPFDKAEENLLNRLQTLKPVAEHNAWEVHLLERPMKIAVGVRTIDPRAKTPGSGQSSDAKVEQPLRRVVCWGWLFPQGNRQFTAYCVQTAGTIPSAESAIIDVPLPTGAQRLLTVQGTGSGGMISFSGQGSAEAWKRFYDDWGRKQGWRPIEWRQAGSGLSAKVLDQSAGRELNWYFVPRGGGATGKNDWLGLIDMIPIQGPRGNP